MTAGYQPVTQLFAADPALLQQSRRHATPPPSDPAPARCRDRGWRQPLQRRQITLTFGVVVLASLLNMLLVLEGAGAGQRVWTYVYNQPIEGLTPIPHGDYRRYIREVGRAS